MMHSTAPEPLFFGPLSPDWTINDLLGWIGGEDARCHDERLFPVLDAVEAALGATSLPFRGRVVAHVRLLASRVAADPALGERELSGVVLRQRAVGVDRVLVTA